MIALDETNESCSATSRRMRRFSSRAGSRSPMTFASLSRCGRPRSSFAASARSPSNIAKSVVALGGDYNMPQPANALRRFARAASQRLRDVVESLMRGDAAKAQGLWRTDNEIDEMYAGLCRELLTYMMAEPTMSPAAVQLLFCAKNIELIGDHVTNIAEAAHYLAQGQRISHAASKARSAAGLEQISMPLTAEDGRRKVFQDVLLPRKPQRRVRDLLQLIERQSRHHFAHRKAAVGDVEHREIGIDAIDGADRGERISAAAHQPAVAGFGLVLHDDPELPRAGGKVHGAADRGRRIVVRHRPIGDVAVFGDLKSAEHAEIEMPAANERESCRRDAYRSRPDAA